MGYPLPFSAQELLAWRALYEVPADIWDMATLKEIDVAYLSAYAAEKADQEQRENKK